MKNKINSLSLMLFLIIVLFGIYFIITPTKKLQNQNNLNHNPVIGGGADGIIFVEPISFLHKKRKHFNLEDAFGDFKLY